MAGTVGVSPWSYTWGELSLMAEGKDEAEWWHTATLVSTMLGMVGVKRSAEELNPYVAARNRRKSLQPELQAAVAEANKTAWRAFCNTFKS
jgi:hypothetical protein